MTNHKEALTTTHEARRQAVISIANTSAIFAQLDVTTTAKIYAAHAITHLAQAAADLTRLRRELSRPGGTQ